MNILKQKNLNKIQKDQAIKLIKTCQEYDKSYNDMFLSNAFNFDKEMNSFFMTFDEEKMIGLLSVYADSADNVQIRINVNPSYRRQGIATALYKEFKIESEKYNLENVFFQVEQNFLDDNPDFMDNLKLKYTGVTDSLLVREAKLYDIEEYESINLNEAKLSHIPEITDIHEKSFNSDRDALINYSKESILGEDMDVYILKDEDKIIASCAVDTSYEDNYLYKVSVSKDYRGKGIGTYLIKTVINKVTNDNQKNFQLVVVDSNIGAKKLYEKLGFKFLAKLVYVSFDDETSVGKRGYYENIIYNKINSIPEDGSNRIN